MFGYLHKNVLIINKTQRVFFFFFFFVHRMWFVMINIPGLISLKQKTCFFNSYFMLLIVALVVQSEQQCCGLFAHHEAHTSPLKPLFTCL